jgi:hypothetical protein
MHKILFSLLFALLLALAVVGVKKMVFHNTTSASNQTLVADGGAPRPPIPW